MARLEEICTINMGQSPESSSYNEQKEGLPFFQGNADFGKISPAVRIWCNSPTKIAHEGDILLSVRAPIGALNIADRTCCIGRGLAALTADESKCSRRFLWHALSSKVEELNSKGTGSTFKAISKKVLFETEIPLPTLSEQTEIVQKLDVVDNLQAWRNSQLSKLDQLVKARFVEMFGDPESNPLAWKEEKLEEYVKLVGGYTFKSEGFAESGIPVLRIGNINAGFFKPDNLVFWRDDDDLEKYKIFPGDLVISLTGTVGKEDYGNVCILDDTYSVYYLNQRNAKIRLSASLNKIFLAEILKFSKVKKKLTGISRGIRQANISNADIYNLRIPIPPINLQEEFASFVQRIDKTKTTVKQSLEKLETLKKSLMQEYFG